MTRNMFTNDQVSSTRILYTPSDFARANLLHLQEVGSLRAVRPHVSSRLNLASYLFFVVKSGSGWLVYDGVNPGQRMNYHSHAHRDEVWTVVAGTGTTIVDGATKRVHAGDVITMPAGVKHTIIAETELKVIEVQIGEDISVSDKIKYDLV